MNMANHFFSVGEWVRVKDVEMGAKQELQNECGDPPYEITSMCENWVRVNGQSSGRNYSFFELADMDTPFTFIVRVADTTRGEIHRVCGGKTRYTLKLRNGKFLDLNDDRCNEVDRYLESKKQFNDDLFTFS